jgi:acetolactate synthase regulatory subunit
MITELTLRDVVIKRGFVVDKVVEENLEAMKINAEMLVDSGWGETLAIEFIVKEYEDNMGFTRGV